MRMAVSTNIPGQIGLFDTIEQPQADIIEEYLNDVVLRGTGFVDGKKRVNQFYEQNMSTCERIKCIKEEYGLGGAGWPLDGVGMYGYDTYHNGITIQYRDETGEHEKKFEWKKVEEVIHYLIDNGKYLIE